MAVTINGTTGILAPDIGIDGTTLIVDEVNNRVGIGDSSPIGALSVAGNIYSTADQFQGENAGVFFSGWNDYGAGVYGRNSGNDLVMNAGSGEKLRITSGGNVGINQTNPTKKLEVAGGAVSFSPDTAGKHTHEFTTNAANDGRYFIKSDTTTKVDIQANGVTYFNGGFVGIGKTPQDTNNFTMSLDVNGPSGSAVYVRTAASGTNFGLVGHYGTTFYLRNQSNGRTQFDTNGTERMRIAGDGNVNIGPSANANGHGLLTLSQTASAAFNALVIQQGNTGFNATDGLHIGIDAGVDAYFKTFENRDFIFYTGSTNTEKLRITSAGNVGIGYNDPATKLVVGSTDSSAADMRFQNSTTGYATNNGFWVGINNNENALLYNYHNSKMLFATNDSVRMTILSDGKVGINETAPTRALSIDGSLNIQSGSRIESYSSGGNLIIQGGSTYPGGHIKMWGGTSDDAITFNTSGGSASSIERMRVTSGGIVKINTPTIVAGTNAENALLQIKSVGQYDGIVLGNSYSQACLGTDGAGAIKYTANAAPANLGGGLKFTHQWYSGSAGGGGPNEIMSLSTTGDLYLGPYDSPGSYTATANNVPYEIKVAPYGWQHHSEIAAISMGSHYGTGQDDGQIIFKTAINVHSDATGVLERVRITEDGLVYINGTGTSGGTSGSAFTPVRIQGNDAATLGADVRIRGGSTGYCHSSVSLQSTSSGNTGGTRGLGTYMYDEVSDVEWYAGRPYSGNDYYMITRDGSVTYGNSSGQTAQHGKKVMALDNSRRMSTSGREYHFCDRLYDNTHRTSRIVTSKGKQGTLTTCTIVISCHSYGTLSYDISLGGYSNAGYTRKGTCYINGALYGHHSAVDTSMGGISHTFQYLSSQKFELVFSKNGGFVHPICSVDASFGGDGYFDPGDVSITWS